jgi:HPt (histidine-containing phosphotransfer) domain-containing protein
MTVPRFPSDMLPPPPAAPRVGGGSLLALLRRAKYDEDFFGTDQAKKETAKAVFAGSSELPSDPSAVPSTFDAMRRQAEGAGRVLDQAKAGVGVGVAQSVVDIPEFLTDFALNVPGMVRRGGEMALDHLTQPGGRIYGSRTYDRQRQETTAGVREAFAPVAEPVRRHLQDAANSLVNAPQTAPERIARVGGQVLGGVLVPMPTVGPLARGAGRLVDAAAEGRFGPGLATQAVKLAPVFGRTNKGYLETTEVARRLLERQPDEAITLAAVDDVPSARVVELPGDGVNRVLVRQDDHLYNARVTPEHKAALTQRLVQGVIDDVRHGLADGDIAAGAGWYRSSVKQMEQELQQVYPELADPNKMAYAKLLIAATSPNNAPTPNLRQAMDIYARFRFGQVEPSAVAPGVLGTLSNKEIDEKLKSLEMVRTIFTEEAGGNADQGLADLIQWLQSPGAQRRGRSEAMPIINDLLGRKTSNFWLNLMGNDQHVTADVWAIRNARRHWGYHIVAPKRVPVPGKRGQYQVDPNKLGLDGAPTDPEYDAIEDAYRLAAEQISKETGQPLSPMDVQAITWYREKKLYDQAGAIPSGLDDFAVAAKEFRANPTEVLDAEHGDLAIRTLDTYYGKSIRPRQVGQMDDAEALRRVNAERNAGLRQEVGADRITDAATARQLLLKSEKGSADAAAAIALGAPAGGAAAGGLAGGFFGDDEEDIERGMIAGAALAGGGLALGARAAGRGLRSTPETSVAPVPVLPTKRITSNQAWHLKNAVEKGGGFTFDPRTGSFVKEGGFMVGGVPGQKGMAVEKLTAEALNRFMQDNADLLSREGMMFGGWFDDGKFYLDVSERVPDEAAAMALIKQRGEKSAWNLDKMEELRNPDVTEAVSAGGGLAAEAPVIPSPRGGNARGLALDDVLRSESPNLAHAEPGSAPNVDVDALRARIEREKARLKTANGEYAEQLQGNIRDLEGLVARAESKPTIKAGDAQLQSRKGDIVRAVRTKDGQVYTVDDFDIPTDVLPATHLRIAQAVIERAFPGDDWRQHFRQMFDERGIKGALDADGGYVSLDDLPAGGLWEYPLPVGSAGARPRQGAPQPKLPVADDYAKIDSFNTDPAGEARLRAEVERLGPATIGHPKQVVSWDETRATAEQVAADIGLGSINTRSVNTRLGGPEMLAIRNIVSQNLARLEDLVKRTQKPGGDAEADALIAAIEIQNDALLRKFIRSRSATGRDLNNLKILANATMDETVWLAKAQNMLAAAGKKLTADQKLKIQQFAKANDRQGMVGFISDLRPATLREKGVTLWKAGLLTSPSTHVANVTGNTAMAALEVAKDAPAAIIDRLFSAVTATRTKDFSPAAAIQASFSGARAGLKNAKLVMQGKLRPRAVKGEIDTEVNFDSKLLDVYTKSVFRALEAQDQVFLQAAIRRSLSEQARVLAKGNKQQVAALLKTPSDEMMIQAIADAEYATFRESDDITNAIVNLRRAFGIAGDVAAPFVKTPTNIARTVIDYSPAGFAKLAAKSVQLLKLARNGNVDPGEIRVLQRAAAEAGGRAAVGTIPLLVGYLLARDGVMTGARAKGKSEYEQDQLEGKQPNALLTGDDWRSIARFAPLGNLLVLGANMYHIGQNPELSTGQKVAGGAASIGTTLLETPFLQGVDEIQKALSDPVGAGGDFVRNTAGSVVPNIVRRASRAIDPVVRETESDRAGAAGLAEEMGNAVVAGTPFSRNLPARVNQFGEPMARSLNILEALFDPTNPRPDETRKDSVIAALAQADARISQLKRKKGETGAEYRQRQVEVGKAVKQILSEMIAEGVTDADSLEAAVRKHRASDTRRRKAGEATDFFGGSEPADTTTTSDFF